MKTLKPLIFSLALGLSGCISATPYQRFSFPRGGYDTKPLQDGIYQIDFAANGVTAQSQAAYYALVRAAEVTLQSGHRFVQNERTEMKPLPVNPNVISPIVTLEIRTVATNVVGAKDAAQIARNSQVAGVKLEPATIAALAGGVRTRPTSSTFKISDPSSITVIAPSYDAYGPT